MSPRDGFCWNSIWDGFCWRRHGPGASAHQSSMHRYDRCQRHCEPAQAEALGCSVSSSLSCCPRRLPRCSQSVSLAGFEGEAIRFEVVRRQLVSDEFFRATVVGQNASLWASREEQTSLDHITSPRSEGDCVGLRVWYESMRSSWWSFLTGMQEVGVRHQQYQSCRSIGLAFLSG